MLYVMTEVRQINSTSGFAVVVCRVARAGPREKIYFDPEEVNAAIVTCGGLCPGLNDVIRQVTDPH